MAKSKSIQEQIADLENRAARLEELEKLFNKAIQNEFGLDIRKIHRILEHCESDSSEFEKQIAAYFNLKSNEDFCDFLAIFCTESSLDNFNKKRSEENVSDAE